MSSLATALAGSRCIAGRSLFGTATARLAGLCRRDGCIGLPNDIRPGFVAGGCARSHGRSGVPATASVLAGLVIHALGDEANRAQIQVKLFVAGQRLGALLGLHQHDPNARRDQLRGEAGAFGLIADCLRVFGKFAAFCFDPNEAIHV
ncbi:hypothetical protein ABC766_00165 [Methylobacterium fujisawaense]